MPASFLYWIRHDHVTSVLKSNHLDACCGLITPLILSFFFLSAVTGLGVGVVFSVLLFKRKCSFLSYTSKCRGVFLLVFFVSTTSKRHLWVNVFLPQVAHGRSHLVQVWDWAWDTPTASMTLGHPTCFMAAWLR